jgi:uncharacterized protein involved in tolerance to divalent cations
VKHIGCAVRDLCYRVEIKQEGELLQVATITRGALVRTTSPPVRSIYRWQGEIHERTEGRVSLHTSRNRVPEIIERAKQEHPYEVPGVSTRPIDGGNPDYLAWIAQETNP